MGRALPELEYQRKIRRKWLRAGGCAVCGQPRGMTFRRASWGKPRGAHRTRRKSKRFCQYHLEKNAQWQLQNRRKHGA